MSDKKTPPTTPSKMRPAIDAENSGDGKKPLNEDEQLDIALDETYPASDPPAETRPHDDRDDDGGKKPAPSTSGGD